MSLSGTGCGATAVGSIDVLIDWHEKGGGAWRNV